MVAVLYLIVCTGFGISLIHVMIPDIRRFFSEIAASSNPEFFPELVFTIPAGFLVGTLSTSMFSYYLTYILARCTGHSDGIRALGMEITVLVFVLWMVVNVIRIKKRGLPIEKYQSNVSNNRFYGISIGVFLLLASFLMIDSYRLSGNSLQAGYAAMSDLAPYTALTSSFARGFNFPTQYPHFAADGIQYHFFFYYFCGTLEYLGMPIDLAINIPSILSMVSTLMLTGSLAALLAKKRTAFVLAPVLVLFRSSFNFIMQYAEYFASSHSLTRALAEMLASKTYYGKTPYEDWGVWTINIYGNQRHLMFGLACVVLLVMLFVPYVRKMCAMLASPEMRGKKLRTFLIGKESWLPVRTGTNGPWRTLALALLIVVPLPYFHGSEMISALLILALMAVFSNYRLIYAILAIVGVLSSVLQTRLFSGAVEKVFKLRIHLGFYSASIMPWAVISYLVAITGLTLILALVYIIWVCRKEKKDRGFFLALWGASLMPLIFAFVFQPTSELLTNHKFVQTTIILMDVFVACFLLRLRAWDPKGKKQEKEKKQDIGKILSAVLLVPLTLSAVFEWAVYANMNTGHKDIKHNSRVVDWICRNTRPDDVFLTPDWDFASFFLSGRGVYYGYTYYAWSAGHDVFKRVKSYCELVSGCGGDAEAFTALCKKEGIDYVIASPDYLESQLPEPYTFEYDPAFFAENLTQVEAFPEENIIIYQVEG